MERAETPGTVEVWVEPQESLSTLLGLRYVTAYSSINACIANLKQIEQAKENWALEARKGPKDIPIDTDLFGSSGYVPEKPTCWRGGIYILGPVSEPPRCSVPGHSLP